ncbi:HAD-IA family hydrolase [Streptomyces kronopolitis]|uniref:HAD family hydrolase n=1 Tax=Streptomyces kronopolitis TaxID=1612435 RepID=UPI00342297A8
MPDTREIAEAMILVDRARTDAGRTHLRSLFRGKEPDGADAQRREAEREAFAADMAVLERSPTRADIARVTARYAHVHARAVRDVAVEPPAVAPPAGVAEAVLLDWAGTVAHLESTDEWLSGALAEAGITVPAQDRAAWVRQAEAAGLPGGRRPADLSPHDLAAWWRRDLDPQAHRSVYDRLLEEAGLPWPEAAGALYRRTMSADGWRIDPAARRAVVRLCRAGVRLAVVSNIGWDLRPVLCQHDLMTWISDCVMSYDIAARKPGPTIFTVACQRLGVQPRHAVMVGDNPEADQGGKALGIRTIILPRLSGEDRWEPVLDAALGFRSETSS